MLTCIDKKFAWHSKTVASREWEHHTVAATRISLPPQHRVVPPVGKNAEEGKQQTPNYSRAAVTPANALKRTEGKVWNLVRYFCSKHLHHKHFSAEWTGLGQFCHERSTVLLQLVEMLAFLPAIDGFNEPKDDDDLPKNWFLFWNTLTLEEKEVESLKGIELNSHFHELQNYLPKYMWPYA